MGAEATIASLHRSGDFDQATSETLRTYGPEVLGLLMALHRDETAAGDAFAEFSERLWRSMARFRWDCSMRTWAYGIARATSVDRQRSLARDRGKKVPLSQSPGVAEIAQQIKSSTLSFLRTEKRTAMQQMREELAPDDQSLLVLRIDREMAWKDLARVFLGEEEANAAELEREAARLRKRFQSVKERLVKIAKRRGIVRK